MDEKVSEKLNEDILKECPRFKSCNANVCPLDSSSQYRIEIVGEEKCGLTRSVRLRIGKKWQLPRLGLKNSEWAARKRFENLSPEERETFVRTGAVSLKTANHRSSQPPIAKKVSRLSPDEPSTSF